MPPSFTFLSKNGKAGAIIWLVLAVGLGAAILWSGRAAAQAPTQGPVITDDEVNAIARQLYCPVCENIPLDVCPTTACAQWRGTIRDLLAQGKSPQEIKDYFVARFGDRVLAEPPRSGLSWIIYILPPALILAGAVFVVLLVWRLGRKSPARVAPAPENNLDEAYMKRLEEELRQREKS